MSLKILAFSLLATLVAGAVVAFVIFSSVNEEKRQMIYSLHSRAESLVWSAEGAARYSRRSSRPAFPLLITEMSLQPGVAWIAVVNSRGEILVDGDPRLEGTSLYSPAEMRALAPETEIKGRFSPDDPNVYETWKIFKKSQDGRETGRETIFVALDAGGFRERLRDYALNLALLAGLLILSSLAVGAALFYTYKFRRSRRELRDARALTEQIFANYPAALILTNRDFKITYANREARELFNATSGVPAEDIKGPPWERLKSELGEKGVAAEFETSWIDRNGETLEERVSALSVGEGTNASYLFIFTNLDEINALKKKLAQSRRLTSIGKLAAGLAHEIRNPLSSICGYARYLAQRLADDPPALAAAGLLEEEARRLNGTLSDLIGFARLPRLKLEEKELAPVVEKAVRVATPDAIAKGAKLIFEAPKEMARVPLDADRLLQALLNIIFNAVQAVSAGGTVKVSLERHSGEWRVVVRDDGPGMDEETLEQIFTPYFTSKADGVGLGLSLAQQIVESHGWTLTAASEPGKGASFSVVIKDAT